MKIAYIYLLMLAMIIAGCGQDFVQLDPELAKLQGRWEGKFQGVDMGASSHYQKEIEVKGDQYIETTNVYFSIVPERSEKSVLLASIIDTSTIKVIEPLNSHKDIIERKEIIENTYFKIADITKNSPDSIFSGNVTPRAIVDQFLVHTGNNKKLNQYVFDNNNQVEITGTRKGMEQSLGHKFSADKNEFTNYFIKNGKPELDVLSPFTKMH